MQKIRTFSQRTTPASARLVRRRFIRSRTGNIIIPRTRRSYSKLSPEESKAALLVYKKIRQVLSLDRKFFLRETNFSKKLEVNTPAGVAVIENIGHARPKDYLGGSNWGALKISLNEKAMFVKIDNERSARERALGTKFVEAFLKRIGGKFQGISFEVINLHLAHDFKFESGTYSIYATDFANWEHIMPLDSEAADAQAAVLAAHNLQKALSQAHKKYVVGEITGENYFLNATTGTVLLFDLHARQRKK